MRNGLFALAVAGIVAASPAAANPREVLTQAAFETRDKATALSQIASAQKEAEAILARKPGDRDARLAQAMAIGYRAKLTRGIGDAKTSRRLFEQLAASNPRDAEAQAAYGCWHLDAVSELGGLIAGAALGAKRATGQAALDRAVALGKDRAMVPALAAMVRIRDQPKDVAAARALAESSVASPAPLPIDRIMQRRAAALLVPLKAGDGRQAAQLARTLLPFGRVR